MSVHYADATVTLHHGDCLDVLRSLPDASVDSVVTDPPYNLGFIGQAWDRPASAARGYKTDDDLKVNPYSRARAEYGGASYGQNGAESGRAFQEWCELWAAECLRVLKPGGHLLAFGGTRTWHRLTCAVEDAGFEVRDSIAWLYGSGFPKSLDVSKAIDKRPGVMRHAEFAADLRAAMAAKGYTNTFDVAEKVLGRRTGAVANWQKYQFPEAKWWPALRDLLDMDEGKWGPVIAEAERAKVGTRAGNRLAVAPGQGMDRSAVDLDVTANATDAARTWQGWGTALKPAFEPVVVARKPLVGTVAANVLEHGTGALNIDGCRIETSDEDKAAINAKHAGMDAATYVRRPGDSLNLSTNPMPLKPAAAHAAGRWPANVVLDESQAEALDEQSGEAGGGTGRSTRGGGGGGEWNQTDRLTKPGQTIRGDGREIGYGDTGGASRFFYVAKADATERPRVNGTAHPTVKPLALMRWLVRLVTPPGGTVLEPFAGSGTTVEACIVEGFHCIAIEREADYLPLIEARIARRRDPVKAITLAGDDLGLFGEATG